MNRTDRLLAIVLELQGKGRARAEDLAETFETSKRTIYRDMQALGEAGVPLVSTPGHGYALMKGYFLPPLSFTTDEATMLLLGNGFLAQNFDAQYRIAAESAARKITGALPEQLRAEVAEVQENIHLIGTPTRPEQMEVLQQLRRAILQKTAVRFRYYARHAQIDKEEISLREADPYSLIYAYQSWHLTAYCHLRQAMRNFRLERIENLELLTHTFKRHLISPFQQQEHNATRVITIRALCDEKIARWVQESRYFFIVSAEKQPEGLLITLTVRQEEDALQWLLSWGGHIQVLEPATLRQRMRQEIEQMLEQYR